MSKLKVDDQLYNIFEDLLFTVHVDDHNEDEFVSEVVDKYIGQLKKLGQLPGQFIDDVREDLASEVYDMLLKKIYGHFNLYQFRLSNGITKPNS